MVVKCPLPSEFQLCSEHLFCSQTGRTYNCAVYRTCSVILPQTVHRRGHFGYVIPSIRLWQDSSPCKMIELNSLEFATAEKYWTYTRYKNFGQRNNISLSKHTAYSMVSASKDAISGGYFPRGVKHRTVGTVLYISKTRIVMLLHTQTCNITVNSYKPRCAMEAVDTAAYAICDWEYTGIRAYKRGPKCPKVPYTMAATPRSGADYFTIVHKRQWHLY